MIDQVKKTAVTQFRKGNRREAVEMLRDFLLKNPAAAELYAVLGYMAFQIEERDVAESALERAVRLQGCDKHSFVMLCLLQSITDQKKALETALNGIKCHPDSAELYNLAGMYQTALGHPEEGESLFHKAMTLEPENIEFRYNLAVCKIHLKAYEAALSLLQSFQNAVPLPAEYYLHVALCHDNLGHFNHAVHLYEQLVAENNDGIAALNLARMFRRTGREPEITYEHYQKALELHELSLPVAEEFADVMLETCRYDELLVFIKTTKELGLASPLLERILADGLSRMGNQNSAEEHLIGLIEQDSNDWVAMNQLALICKGAGRDSEALEWIKKAASVNPSNPEILYNLAQMLHGHSPETEVIQVFQHILEIEPGHTKALNDLGLLWLNRDDYQKAAEYFKRALAITATMPELLNNYGMYLYQTRQYEYAERIIRRAIQLKADSPELHKNLSMILLVQGKLEEGFSHYEWRLKRETRLAYRMPRDKSEFAGSTVLICHEQGLGDTIQFIRYVKDLVELGARVLVELPLELHPLFKDKPWIERLLRKSETSEIIDHCDFVVPVMSLPKYFTKVVADISSAESYIIPDTEKLKKWECKTAVKTMKVGFVWGGNKKQVNDFRRTILPETLTPLLRIPDITWFCLQLNRNDEFETVFSSFHNVVPAHKEIEDFSDTTALISQLDIVVTVCTSVAHLAGAMGKQTLVMLAYAADWRWFISRNDSPYYKSMTLFRQIHPGDWDSVIRQVKEYLTQMRVASEKNL